MFGLALAIGYVVCLLLVLVFVRGADSHTDGDDDRPEGSSACFR